ncbi:alpha/beta hydrolase [Ruficoccus amylovorans]|uniref:Alpha/beta hydrolase n=1 Tax=Ruficoccus amylovorans TaxID=1804625 RepID=A0A842HGT6_9BACT|nr:alpha/beta hydrolase [Ruficoccus amylovorans]MBC2595632.1 alpha/beta hydrolase [Ruficoccus amylovorans]
MKTHLCAALTLALAMTLSLAATPRSGEIVLPITTAGEATPPPELVTYRQKHLDDRGLNRTIRDISQPTLNLFLPEHPLPGHPAVVICPGGGYAAVVYDREGLAIARYLSSQGVAAAVLKYRLPAPDATGDGLPRSQQDALAAIRYLRDHSADLDINPDRIGIMGFSAGGHLAGSTAVFGTREEGTRPDFVALVYPVVSMSDDIAHRGSRDNLLGSAPSEQRLIDFSLDRRVTGDWPPFFLVHATDDKVVVIENSERLATALKEHGVPTVWMPVSSGGHGFSLGRTPESSVWKERFIEWVGQLD